MCALRLVGQHQRAHQLAHRETVLAGGKHPPGDPGPVSKAVAGVEAIFLMQVGGGTEQTKTMIAEEAHLMERLNEVFRGRRSVAITDDVENITGMAPATFRDWCQRHADAFR